MMTETRGAAFMKGSGPLKVLERALKLLDALLSDQFETEALSLKDRADDCNQLSPETPDLSVVFADARGRVRLDPLRRRHFINNEQSTDSAMKKESYWGLRYWLGRMLLIRAEMQNEILKNQHRCIQRV
jgi:hypothetical protein